MDSVIPEPDTAMPGICPDALKLRDTEVGEKVLTALEIAHGDQGAVSATLETCSYFSTLRKIPRRSWTGGDLHQKLYTVSIFS
jgi:hypothetical protein